MTASRDYWWRIALDLRMRQLSGDSFQAFFSDVMTAVHGDDFVRVRPFGQRGDKGCDGYLMSTGIVFQCYGAVNGDGGKVDYLIGKMEDDFAKAATKLPTVMKEWRMVHNIVDGLPIEAVEKLKEIQAANPKIKCEFVGMERIAEMILRLDEGRIEQFLGPAATTLDTQNLQASELRDLINAIVVSVDTTATDEPIGTVSPQKLAFNDLPNHWRALIAAGWQNAPHVATYFSRHPDPLTGERIANVFRDRYAYLRSQGLSAAAIMSSLYSTVTGIGHVVPERQVAAQALLAHLFESCDIFEDAPVQALHA